MSYNDMMADRYAHECGLEAEELERFYKWQEAKEMEYLSDPQGINSILDAIPDDMMAAAFRSAATGDGETFIDAYNAAINNLFSFEMFKTQD